MAQLELFLVAESVSVDQGTNKVSVFEVLESVPFRQEAQNAISRCVAFSLWRMEDGDDGQDFQVSLRVHRPGIEAPDEQRTNFTAHSPRHRVFTHVLGLPLPELGTLRFEVLLNGEHSADHVVSISPDEDDLIRSG